MMNLPTDESTLHDDLVAEAKPASTLKRPGAKASNEEDPEETSSKNESDDADDEASKDNEEETKREGKQDKGFATKEDETYFRAGEDGKSFRIPLRLTKSGRKRATPFPMKLMKVLSEKNNEDIIAWTPSGKAFSILQPKAFCSKILPEEFKSAKYSSFTRKLHRWGFMRHYRGQDAGAFYHKHFQRDRLDLVEKMSCYKPVNSVSSKNPSFSPSDPPEPSASVSAGGGAGATESDPDESAAAAAATTVAAAAAATTATGGGGGTGPQQAEAPTSTQADATFAMVMQQQQIQQLQQQQLQQMQLQLQQQGTGPLPFAMEGNSDLNTAIELEVSRRLKERINAAALSRQMMMMPPQQQQQQQSQGGAQGPGAFDSNAAARSLIYPGQGGASMGASTGIPNFPSMQSFPFPQQPQPQGAFSNIALQGGVGGFNQPFMNAGGGFKPFEAPNAMQQPQPFGGMLDPMTLQQMPQMAAGMVPSNDRAGTVESDPDSTDEHKAG